MMTFDEIDADNPKLLILNCANGDGTLYLARQHVTGIFVDWLQMGGVITVLTTSMDEFEVQYSDRDQGALCSDELAAALNWLERQP
jgi:hypothetical protein